MVISSCSIVTYNDIDVLSSWYNQNHSSLYHMLVTALVQLISTLIKRIACEIYQYVTV
jgi:hypothetical protein